MEFTKEKILEMSLKDVTDIRMPKNNEMEDLFKMRVLCKEEM